jgi:large subunit ribosomal protein L30
MMSKQASEQKVKLQQIGSGIGCTRDMRETLRALGLGKMHQVVERMDTPSIRGMIAKIPHLVRVIEQ